MQNWSTLLEQGCIEQFGVNTECDSAIPHDYIFSSGSMTANFIDIPVPRKHDEDMSSKKQLRCVFSDNCIL